MSTIEKLTTEFVTGLHRLGRETLEANLKRAMMAATMPPTATEETAATTTVSRSRRHRRGRGPGRIWIPDNRARRVPTWVMAATGLGTKTAIVNRYGVDARFVRGQGLPPVVGKAAKAVA